jgi:hypothetical protein
MWQYLQKKPLLLILLIALAVRIVYVIHTPVADLVQFESAVFDTKALDLARGVSSNYPSVSASYHLFLAPLYKLLISLNLIEWRVFMVVILNCCLALVSTALIYRIAEMLYPQRPRLIILIALLFACYYPNVYFNGLILSENLFTPLIIGIFYLAIVKQKNYALIGVLFGLAIIVRPAAMAFLPFYLIWLYPQITNKLFTILRVLLPVMLIIVLASLINQQSDRAHHLSYTANGGANFVLTWCQPRRIISETVEDGSTWFSPPVFHGKNPSSDIQIDRSFYDNYYLFSMGLNCIAANPQRLITNLANPLNLIDSVFYPNLRTRDAVHNELVLLWKVITMALIVPFVLFPVYFKANRRQWSLAGLLILSLLFVVYASNPGEERYLAPYHFNLLLFGIPPLVLLLKHMRQWLSGLSISKLLPIWLAGMILIFPVGYLSGVWAMNELNQLRRPVKLYVEPSDSELKTARTNATNWLISHLDSATLAEQIELAPILALAARASRDPTLEKAAVENIDLLKQLTRVEDGLLILSAEKEISQLAATTQLLLGLLFTESGQPSELTIDLAKSILASQESDGSFDQAGGEIAMWACSELYSRTNQSIYLDCVTKASEFYFKQLEESKPTAQWVEQLLAYASIEQFSAKAQVIVDRLVALQTKQSDYEQLLGSFPEFNSRQSALAIYALARSRDQDTAAQIEHGMYSLVELQVDDPSKLNYGAVSDSRNKLNYSLLTNANFVLLLSDYEVNRQYLT